MTWLKRLRIRTKALSITRDVNFDGRYVTRRIDAPREQAHVGGVLARAARPPSPESTPAPKPQPEAAPIPPSHLEPTPQPEPTSQPQPTPQPQPSPQPQPGLNSEAKVTEVGTVPIDEEPVQTAVQEETVPAAPSTDSEHRIEQVIWMNDIVIFIPFNLVSQSRTYLRNLLRELC